MRSGPPPAAPVVLDDVTALVDARLDALFAAEAAAWAEVDADLVPPLAELARFCRDGGKRLRPGFCYWAHVGAGGDPTAPDLADLCGALELLHAFALLHDDVMDGSDSRRGRSTVHVGQARRHRDLGWRGEGRRFGEGVAILLGDLAFTYADRLTLAMPLPVRRLFAQLRVELNMGQYLDLQSAARGDASGGRAERILVYKSAKYTIERPLHLGAALAGRADLADGLSAFGLPLGEAFQLRDDVLGVFGDAEVVGKPVGDDLREGKVTVLLSEALAQAGPAELEVLALVGQPDLGPDDVDRLRQVVEATGARRAVEARIEARVAQAVAALEAVDLTPAARAALVELADFVARRTR